MKKTKEQLLLEIQDIENREKLDSKKKQLQAMKKDVGKGWCTHSISTYMTKGRAAYEFHAFFVDDAKMDNERNPVYVIRQATIIKQDDIFRFNAERSDYTGSLPFWLGSFRYEINEKEFTKIYEEAVAAVEKGIDHIRNSQPVGYKVSQGDHTNGSNMVGHLRNIGYKFINMENEEPLAFQLLKSNGHPFLYNNLLMKNIDSLLIATMIADDVSKKASSWGGVILERDMPRAEALRRFINKYK